MKAARRFDERRGFKFISYAVRRIRQTILEAIAKKGRIVYLPGSQNTRNKKVKNTAALLATEFDREPTEEELADVLGMTAKQVARTLMTSNNEVSLDAPFPGNTGDEGITWLDILPSDDIEGDNGSVPTSRAAEKWQDLHYKIAKLLDENSTPTLQGVPCLTLVQKQIIILKF